MENEEEKKSNEVKTEKPIYKKWWFIAIVVVILISIISMNSSDKGDKIDLSKTQLGQYLPALPSNKGKIEYNTDKDLQMKLYNVSQEQYNNYKKECENKGFNIDVSSGSSFEGYNEKSYRLYMYTSDNKMTIDLSAPTELEKITWPTSELASTLPIPEFDGGYVYTDKSNEFNITLGNISKEDYDKYVNDCSEAGYNVNYDKSSKRYKAENSEGNHLEISYNGGRRINIKVENKSEKADSKTPNQSETTKPVEKEETQKKDQTPKEEKTSKKENTNQQKTSSNSKGISKEFKKAMDSYESFMDEYVAFMKKYQSNSTDLSLINQYATIMQKYSEEVKAFEKWDSKDLTTEEAAYYVDVQARVSKKLLEVTK